MSDRDMYVQVVPTGETREAGRRRSRHTEERYNAEWCRGYQHSVWSDVVWLANDDEAREWAEAKLNAMRAMRDRETAQMNRTVTLRDKN